MGTLHTHNITLSGPRVRLHPLSEDDWAVLLSWNNDPAVLFYSEGDEVDGYTLEEVQNIYRTVSQTALCFMIEMQGRPIGECWLQHLNLDGVKALFPGQDCRRIDIVIGEKPFWGRGFGSEAVALLLSLAFERENADVVCACDVGSHNPRSLSMCRRLGFRVERTTVQSPGGKCALTYDLAITHAQWTEREVSRHP